MRFMPLLQTSLRAAAACALMCVAALAQAQAYISGSVSGQLAPGVYGRVDIGNAPAPALVYGQPMLAVPPAAVVAPAQPVYMWVPPEHSRHWRRYCGRYRACGQPVYFLRKPPPHWHGGPARGRAPEPGWQHRHGHHEQRRPGHRHDKGHGHRHGRHDRD